MPTAPGSDESRIRHLLRRRGVGHDAVPPAAPDLTIHLPEDRDWLDRLYEDEDPAEPAAEARPPWHSGIRRPKDPPPAPEPAGPQVHITVSQPSPSEDRAQARLARVRRWLLIHGTAAGTGWYLGLGPAMATYLNTAGQAAAPAGIGLIAVTSMFGLYLPGLPYIPPPLRPPVAWACRIPACTAALALALHAPAATF